MHLAFLHVETNMGFEETVVLNVDVAFYYSLTQTHVLRSCCVMNSFVGDLPRS